MTTLRSSLPVSERVNNYLENMKWVASVTDFRKVYKACPHLPKIEMMLAHKGHGKTVAEIMALLLRFNAHVRQSRKMTEPIMVMSAAKIIEECADWNIIEVAYMLNRAIANDYGDPYGEVDVMTVTNWIHGYRITRTTETRLIKQKESIEPDIKGSEMPEHFKESIKRLEEKFGAESEKKVKEYRKPYESIEDYCEANNMDVDYYKSSLEQQCRQAYEIDQIKHEMTFDQFLKMEQSRHLYHDINGN